MGARDLFNTERNWHSHDVGAVKQTLGVIGNIMNLADVPGYNQQVAKGLIIVVAMLLQNGTRWLRR